MLFSGLLILGSCGKAELRSEIKKLKSEITDLKTTTRVDVDGHIAKWPVSSQKAAQEMLDKYGLPQGITNEMLVWNKTGLFKKTIVYKEDTINLFPERHSDVLEQVVDFAVPKDKVLHLWEFDGSISIDKVKGELIARNQSEEMNVLALNLAVEIIAGKFTPEQARKEFSSTWEAFKRGNASQYVTNLNFSQSSNSGNPDQSIPVIKMQAQEVNP